MVINFGKYKGSPPGDLPSSYVVCYYDQTLPGAPWEASLKKAREDALRAGDGHKPQFIICRPENTRPKPKINKQGKLALKG
jgi:hypothetical protein